MIKFYACTSICFHCKFWDQFHFIMKLENRNLDRSSSVFALFKCVGGQQSGRCVFKNLRGRLCFARHRTKEKSCKFHESLVAPLECKRSSGKTMRYELKWNENSFAHHNHKFERINERSERRRVFAAAHVSRTRAGQCLLSFAAKRRVLFRHKANRIH